MVPGEFLNICQCKLVNLRREGDEVIVEVRCSVQEETQEAPEAGESEVAEQHTRVKAPVAKLLR